jgi:hypothetical protein
MINLFINYFEHKNIKRRQEIERCLMLNCTNEFIDNVIVLSQDKLPFKHKKIVELPTNKIPTYQDFFDIIEDYPTDFNILANLDIYFDQSIISVRNLSANTCYAITRHEFRAGKAIDFQAANNCPPHFSQDVWAFNGMVNIKGCDKVIAVNLSNNQHELIDFTMGVPGCDNVIAYKLSERYVLKNPYIQFRCIHLHEDQGRPTYKYRITGDHSRWGQLKRVPITGL